MKKILLFSIIVFCGLSAAKAQDIVNLRMDRYQMGLRGNVASMDEDILLRKDYFREDWPERKWFINDLRNILREDEGRVLTFNQAGRITSITYTHQGKAGKKTVCSYASNGLLSSFVGEGYKVEARYDGNMADINVYAETHDYKSKVDLGKADLNTTPYTNSYPFDLKCRQELTDDGLVLTSKYYFVDSMPAKVCEYKYNHLNMLTSEKITDYSHGDEPEVTTVRYTYDNRGFLTKKVMHGKAVDETYTYENNETGDCTKMTIERPYGTFVYTFEYLYDSVDNWTVRLQFLNGQFENAALRTLTYHKAAAAKKSPKNGDGKGNDAVKQADKDRAAAAKKAEKEAKAQQRAEMKERERLAKEAMKDMTPEERKAAKEQLAAEKKAAKEAADAQRKAEQEQMKTEKKLERERAAAERERVNAEKKAERDRVAAEKKAERERAAAEKKAKKSE